jgi:hypothetical protein
MPRGDTDDIARGIANLEVLDQQRLARELGRQQHGAFVRRSAQSRGFTIARGDAVRRQSDHELLRPTAVRDDGRLGREARMTDARHEVRRGQRSAEPEQDRQE